MSWTDFTRGCAAFLGVIVAGFLSTAYVDRYFAAQTTGGPTASASQPAPAATPAPSPTPVPSPGPAACVDADGSWKNWPYPNVPALGPKCPPEQK